MNKNRSFQQQCHYTLLLLCSRISVSKPAPEWEATAVVDGDFTQLSLSSFRGKYLVFFFYPLDLWVPFTWKLNHKNKICYKKICFILYFIILQHICMSNWNFSFLWKNRRVPKNKHRSSGVFCRLALHTSGLD